ncbi:hypothetical protein TNCT_331861 [Trichonephila clavata]|uniref:Uncharacterized protein n=1 Tax=Trichonephila clavata TaxID=2740835 RepID=A0A8X6F522_TRICU|nr:hypothetical protein TNCT_331861 [Trichonephila clavata]
MPLKIIRFLTFLRKRYQRMRLKFFSRKLKRPREEDISDSTEEESIEMEFSSETSDSQGLPALQRGDSRVKTDEKVLLMGREIMVI